MQVYFDNSASTAVRDEVIELMIQTMREDYANPSAMHVMGMCAEQYVKNAAEEIAKTLQVKAKEIIFTSGGTESNNMALFGIAAMKKRTGGHIITTAIEHPAIYKPLEQLEEMGCSITVLGVDSKGHIDLENLKESIREDTILVSTMYVNNEIGALEPIREIAGIVHAANPDIVYHVDAIQGYGKYKIRPKSEGIDLLSVSGHKLHGPKGVGFLYVDERIRIKPLIFGGGQQRGMRSGTTNVPGIAGLGLACRMAYENFEQKIHGIVRIKDFLIDALAGFEGVLLNSYKGEVSAPHIISISVADVRSEVLLHALEERGIYVSAGSACSSKNPNIKGTIKNIGIPKELWESTIRISLSEYSSMEEAEYFIQVFREIVPMLRRFVRK